MIHPTPTRPNWICTLSEPHSRLFQNSSSTYLHSWWSRINSASWNTSSFFTVAHYLCSKSPSLSDNQIFSIGAAHSQPILETPSSSNDSSIPFFWLLPKRIRLLLGQNWLVIHQCFYRCSFTSTRHPSPWLGQTLLTRVPFNWFGGTIVIRFRCLSAWFMSGD